MKRVVGKSSLVTYPLESWARIGQGTEGVVHKSKGRCVKTYSSPLTDVELERIEAAARLSKILPGFAWPSEIALDSATGAAVRFVMDHVSGCTLETINQQGCDQDGNEILLVEGEKVHLALQVAQAVAAAHAHVGPRIVLGDVLKSGNLMIDLESVSATFVDTASVNLFGFRDASGEVKDSWSTLNTPGYVPKEVLANPAAIPSQDADLFALAVLLFELLFGKPPHEPKSSNHNVGLDPDDAVRRGLYLRWVRHPDFEAPTYDAIDVPDEIDRIFRAAFLASSRRPDAAEWCAALNAWHDAIRIVPEAPVAEPSEPRVPKTTLDRISDFATWGILAFLLAQVALGFLDRAIPGAAQTVPIPGRQIGPALFREIFR